MLAVLFVCRCRRSTSSPNGACGALFGAAALGNAAVEKFDGAIQSRDCSSAFEVAATVGNISRAWTAAKN
jgi:hypothetical protein